MKKGKGPIQYKGLYPFCKNKTCTDNCAQRITERAKTEAVRQGRELCTIDACATKGGRQHE